MLVAQADLFIKAMIIAMIIALIIIIAWGAYAMGYNNGRSHIFDHEVDRMFAELDDEYRSSS